MELTREQRLALALDQIESILDDATTDHAVLVDRAWNVLRTKQLNRDIYNALRTMDPENIPAYNDRPD